VQDGAAEPVQPGDDQGVAVAQVPQEQVELRPAGFGTAGPVEVDAVGSDPGADQGVELGGGVLLVSGDPRLPQQHMSAVGACQGLPT